MNKLIKYLCKICKSIIFVQTALYGSGLCRSCARKLVFGENCPNYKDGRTNKQYYCKDCNTEICLKNGLTGKGRCGQCAILRRFKNPKNHPRWQGGIGKLPYSFEFTPELKLQIRIRDNFTCQLCYKKEIELFNKISSIHHIDYDKLNCLPNNLISLCNSCNIKVNTNRDYYYAYFTYLMENYIYV